MPPPLSGDRSAERRNRLRIVVSTPTFLPIVGGAEIGIHELCARIGVHHDVIVVTTLPRRRNLDEYGASDYTTGIYEVRYALSRIARHFPEVLVRLVNRTSLPYMIGMWHAHRQGKVDVLNVHFIKRQVGAAFLARALKIPVVTSLVGRSDVVRLLSVPGRLYARAVASATTVAVPNSSFYLRGATFGPRTEVIPYGVDTTAFHPARRDERLREELGAGEETVILLAVQRLAPVKAVDALIAVLRELRERQVDALLVVAGRGEESLRLQEYAQLMGVDDRVRFMGYVPSEDMPALFASSDIYVSHSLFETFGIVFAQAMAAGLPIVAADSSSISDVLSPANGAIVPVGDVLRFADAVESLARDRAAREDIGRRNRARAVRELDWDTIAEAYCQLFAALTS